MNITSLPDITSPKQDLFQIQNSLAYFFISCQTPPMYSVMKYNNFLSSSTRAVYLLEKLNQPEEPLNSWHCTAKKQHCAITNLSIPSLYTGWEPAFSVFLNFITKMSQKQPILSDRFLCLLCWNRATETEQGF